MDATTVVYFPSPCGLVLRRSALWSVFLKYPVLFRHDIVNFHDVGLPSDGHDDMLETYRLQGIALHDRLYMFSDCKFLRCDPWFVAYCQQQPHQFFTTPAFAKPKRSWALYIDDCGSESILEDAE